MDARPLRELLADLAGDSAARAAYGADPAGYLAEHGHADLPEPLVSEAVVSYAGTAPVEVAQALAPYVAVHGPVPSEQAEPESWFDLLTSAQVPREDVHEPVTDEPDDLDFGAGAGPELEFEPSVAAETLAETAPVVDEETEPEWASDSFSPEPPIEGLAPEADDDEEPLD
jgi:hypothetical protein